MTMLNKFTLLNIKLTGQAKIWEFLTRRMTGLGQFGVWLQSNYIFKMIFFKLKIFIIIIAGLFIPAVILASPVFPPEIPVLFYGNVEINNKPAPVNTIISIVAEDNNLEIASSTIENIGKYFIEVPCKNYISESDKNIVFNLDNFVGGQNACPDVMIVPSINFDLSAEYEIKVQEEPKEKNKNTTSSIIFPPTPCVKVIYDNWQTACVNNLQYRNVISKIPANCVMTENQKADTKKQCELIEKTKVLGIEFYPDGSLVRGKDNKIYIIEGKIKKYIKNLIELKKYAGQEIYYVEEEFLNLYKTKNYLNGSLIREKGKHKIYVILNGKKKHILNIKELRLYYFKQKIFNISIEKMKLY